MQNNFLNEIWPHRGIQIHHFFSQGKLLQREKHPSKDVGIYVSPWYHTLLSHYLLALDRKIKVSRPLSPFETLCTKQSPQSHLIATLHSLLFSEVPSNSGWACKTWENKLSLVLSPEEWERVYLSIHKGSVNVSTQENGYKIQTHWYRTPSLIHKPTQTFQTYAGNANGMKKASCTFGGTVPLFKLSGVKSTKL